MLPEFKSGMPEFSRPFPDFSKPEMPSRVAPVDQREEAVVDRREVACAAVAAPVEAAVAATVAAPVEEAPPTPVAAPVEEEIDAGGLLEVLDPSGHFEVRWGRKKTEVEAAEATFKDLLAKGYLAFKRTWGGRKGKRMNKFDPKAGVAIFEQGKACAECGKAGTVPSGQILCDVCADRPKKLPIVATEKKEDDKPEKVDAEPVDDEESYEQTREFDKKAKTTMTPPMRGG